MKRFLSTTAFAVALAMLFILSPDRSLTADTGSATNQPIKVLKVKINPVAAQQSWLDGLELQVQNTSAKTVNYLLLHVDVSGRSLRVPLIFGRTPDAKTRDAQVLQPGAKLTLKAAPALCEKMRAELSANASVPSPQDFQTKINVVIFADKSAWRAGQLHYQDPADSSRWIAAEETQYSHARPRSNSSQQCYRTAGFTLLPCCDSNYVASSNFVADPNGHAQPEEAEACCGSGNCCSYTDIAPCP